MVLTNVRFCPRRHPIDSDRPCLLCAQEEQQQEDRDDKLAEAIVRLVKRGKLSSSVVPFSTLAKEKASGHK